ncbi:nitroreductase [Sphingomonas daechungensis]|uniref:nitroreductase family protein n=1 Tax=Sphingomonas daechungensis TaxID=1176646 RepID=UPI0031EFAD2D
MLNDLSSTLSLLKTRRSGRPREMVGPGPSDDELRQILEIAMRVPDHGKLAPWRFVVVGKDQRNALANLLHKALDAEDAQAGNAHHEKEEEFAHQGEALIVLVSSPVQNHKIPVWEQELSAGAAAMNLLTAAHAAGYVGGWITGWRAYSPTVNAAFAGPGERIVGFIFLGTPGRELEERPRPDPGHVVRKWASPAD